MVCKLSYKNRKIRVDMIAPKMYDFNHNYGDCAPAGNRRAFFDSRTAAPSAPAPTRPPTFTDLIRLTDNPVEAPVINLAEPRPQSGSPPIWGFFFRRPAHHPENR